MFCMEERHIINPDISFFTAKIANNCFFSTAKISIAWWLAFGKIYRTYKKDNKSSDQICEELTDIFCTNYVSKMYIPNKYVIKNVISFIMNHQTCPEVVFGVSCTHFINVKTKKVLPYPPAFAHKIQNLK